MDVTGLNVHQLIHVVSKGCEEWETKNKIKTEEKEQDKKVRLIVRCARCALVPSSSILIIRRSFLNDLRIPVRRTTQHRSPHDIAITMKL